MKKICFFGIYYPDYPRNKVIIEGFKENGFEVLECRVDPRVYKGIKKFFLLAKLARKINKKKVDFVWVAFPGHTCVWLAKILFPNKKIVFDVFISLFEANVSDRKKYSVYSPRALKDKFLDWYSVNLADIVVLDTLEHIKKFGDKYGLKKEKSIRVFISSALPASNEPAVPNNQNFIVHFHGSFIPLHGVEFIVKAAGIIDKKNKDVLFRMVGGGMQLQEMKDFAEKNNIENIEFLGKLPDYKDVLEKIKQGDVAMGTFGTPERMRWVIANKIFESMVFGKTIISADTTAIRELFTDRENILLCKYGDENDLAEKILELKNDRMLRERLGQNSLKLFKEKLSPKRLVENFLVDFKNI